MGLRKLGIFHLIKGYFGDVLGYLGSFHSFKGWLGRYFSGYLTILGQKEGKTGQIEVFLGNIRLFVKEIKGQQVVLRQIP